MLHLPYRRSALVSAQQTPTAATSHLLATAAAPSKPIAQRADSAVDALLANLAQGRHRALTLALDAPAQASVSSSKAELSKAVAVWAGSQAAASTYAVVSRRQARARRCPGPVASPAAPVAIERRLAGWLHAPQAAPLARADVARPSLRAATSPLRALDEATLWADALSPSAIAHVVRSDAANAALGVADVASVAAGVAAGVTVGLLSATATYALVRTILHFESDDAAHRQASELHCVWLLEDGTSSVIGALRQRFVQVSKQAALTSP